jgi:uncharacterized protein YlxP (DUF503 family)
MALHLRLIQLEMYLAGVSSASELIKVTNPLKRFCKDQHNIAMTIEPFDTADRGYVSLAVLGTERTNVEQESEHLLQWIETNLPGQTLQVETHWL